MPPAVARAKRTRFAFAKRSAAKRWSAPSGRTLEDGEEFAPGIEEIGTKSFARTNKRDQVLVRIRRGRRVVTTEDGKEYFKDHHIESIAQIPVPVSYNHPTPTTTLPG